MTQKLTKYQKRHATKVGGAILLSLALLPLILDVDLWSDSHFSGSDNTIAWVEFDEGIMLSKKNGKKILVDVYTDWCTWCKRMDSDVYTDPGVQEQIAKHFIPVKLNAESGESIMFNGYQMAKSQFSKAIGVTGYPTTLFLTEAQEPITLVPGYIKPDRFSVILTYIGEDHYKSTPFQSYISQNSLSN